MNIANKNQKKPFHNLLLNLKIKHKLMLTFLPIPLLAVILLGTLWYWNTLKAVQRTVTEQTSISANNVSILIDDYIEELEIEINSVTKLSWIQDFFSEFHKDNSPQFSEKYQERLKKLLINLGGRYFQINFFNLEKHAITKVQLTTFYSQDELPVHLENIIFDSLDRTGVANISVFSENEIIISDLKSIRGVQTIVFVIVVNDLKSQLPIGIITCFSPVTQIAERIIEKYNIGFASQAMIVDKKGQIIYHSERNKIHQSISAVIPNIHNIEPILTLQEGNAKYFDMKNNALIISYKPLKRIAWNICVMSSIKPFIKSTKQAGLIGICLTVLISILLLFLINFFSEKFVRGISEVSKGARTLAAGDLDRSVPVRSNDEIGELAGNFNKMAKDLKKMIYEVDMHKNLAAIGQFAAGMYHDLKSPLEGLKFLTAGMKRKIKENDPLKQYADEIFIGLENLDQMIHKTLDFVKPESVNFEQVNLNEFIQLVVQGIDVKEVQINCELSAGLPEINLDPSLMRRAISNIITNSIEAMVSGGDLKISTTIDNQFVFIKLTDTGYGIGPDDLKHIFQPFFSTKIKGHG